MADFMHENNVPPKPCYVVSICKNARPRRCLSSYVKTATFNAGLFQWSFENQHAQRTQQPAKHISTALRSVAEACGFPKHTRSSPPLLAGGRLQIGTIANRFKERLPLNRPAASYRL